MNNQQGLITMSDLKLIGNEIRKKLKSDEIYYPSDMPKKILSIPIIQQLDSISLNVTPNNDIVAYCNSSISDYILAEGQSDYHKLIKVEIGNMANGENFTNGILIGNYAFLGCINLKDTKISKNVYKIGQGAFRDCSSLNNVFFEKPTDLDIKREIKMDIGSGVFYGCSSLPSIILYPYIKEIPTNTFYKCSSLRDLTMYNTIKSTGDNSFFECDSMQYVRFYGSIEDWCTTIEFAFNDGNPLTYSEKKRQNNIYTGLYLNDSNEPVSTVALDNKNVSNYAFLGYELLNSVSINGGRIGEESFADCQNLQNISLSNVNSVGEHAFYRTGYYNNADNWSKNEGGSRAGLSINDCFIRCATNVGDPRVLLFHNPRVIADSAFDGHYMPFDLIIPRNVEYIGESTFSMTTIQLDNGIEKITFEEGSNLISIDNGGLGAPKLSVIENFPYDTIEHLGIGVFSGNQFSSFIFPTLIKKIPSYTFSGCTKLSNLEFNKDNIKSIGFGAFRNCTSLTSLHFGEIQQLGNRDDIPSNRVFEPGASVFEGCTNLQTLIFDKIENISNDLSYLFRNCKKLTNLDLGGYKFSKFYKSIFEGCSSIQSLNFDYNVESIEANAFKNCTSLVEFRCKGIKTIKDNPNNGAFLNCTSLEKFICDEDLEYVGRENFFGCTNLKEIRIPKTIKQIGAYAFRTGTGTYDGSASIYIYAKTVPEITTASFSRNNKIYVPRGMQDLYRNKYSFLWNYYVAEFDI